MATRAYYVANKQHVIAKATAWRLANRERYNVLTVQRKRRLRLAAVKFLGGKCANPNCRYLNENGSLGCVDERLLQVDHPRGGGRQERLSFNNNNEYIYKKVLVSKPGEYRLLCACCNWLHRFEDF